MKYDGIGRRKGVLFPSRAAQDSVKAICDLLHVEIQMNHPIARECGHVIDDKMGRFSPIYGYDGAKRQKR